MLAAIIGSTMWLGRRTMFSTGKRERHRVRECEGGNDFDQVEDRSDGEDQAGHEEQMIVADEDVVHAVPEVFAKHPRAIEPGRARRRWTVPIALERERCLAREEQAALRAAAVLPERR
jgi:hypothetical protein